MLGLFKRKKKPANAMEAFIFAAYGNPPPAKTAWSGEAALIAYKELLATVIDQEDVAEVTAKLNAGPIPYSTHDLALSVALHFFKRPESISSLRDAQLVARIAALDWLQKGNVNPLMVQSFEDTLYKLYKP